MRVYLSTNSPEAEIPFWVFCEGAGCEGQTLHLANETNQSQAQIPIPIQQVPGESNSHKWGAELIIPDAGTYSMTLGDQKERFTLAPHQTLSFGEEFIWVFSAIITVLAALFIFMSKKSRAQTKLAKES